MPFTAIGSAPGRGLLFAAVCLTAVLAGTLPAGAETRVSGTLQGTNTWTKEGSPYIVTGDITVGTHASLRIGPGVSVRFKPNIASRGGVNEFDLELLVKGKLVVEGAPGDSVIFTSDAEVPRWEDWQGIVAQGKEARVELRGAIIEYAIQGVKVIDSRLVADGLSVRRCMQAGIQLLRAEAEINGAVITEVGNTGGSGIGINLEKGSRADIRNSFVIGVQNGIAYAQKSGGTLHGTVVTMCVSRGLLIHNSTPEIRRCSITANGIGIIVSGGAEPVVQENNIFENGASDVDVRGFEDSAVKLDFTRNWWGETSLGIIEERILDGLDDPSIKAFTVLEPIQTQAVVTETEPAAKP